MLLVYAIINMWVKATCGVTPALRRLKQEDQEFQASLGYTADPVAKKKKKNREGARVEECG
jgi:hypothetical protein